MHPLIRLALSRNERGDVEIFACATETLLVLPQEDVGLLIANLMSLDQMLSPREIVFLDPSS